MRNPFSPLKQFPNDEEASPRALSTPPVAPIPSITRPEHTIDPEMRRERFKRLSALIAGPKKPSI